MSSYWAGYHGAGLVLSKAEFDGMLERYKFHVPSQKSAVEKAVEDCELSELRIVPSRLRHGAYGDFQTTEDPELVAAAVEVTPITDDFASGAVLWPFYNSEGLPNEIDEAAGICELERRDPMGDDGDPCYVFWADKDMSSAKAFDEKPYASYQEFVQEFKDKLEAYLPERFDWDAHLGNFSYAAYA